jgi:hypothetical protein
VAFSRRKTLSLGAAVAAVTALPAAAAEAIVPAAPTLVGALVGGKHVPLVPERDQYTESGKQFQHGFVHRLHDAVLDAMLDGKDGDIILSRAAYKSLAHDHLIDYVPTGKDGKVNAPVLWGRRISVPGTSFA